MGRARLYRPLSHSAASEQTRTSVVRADGGQSARAAAPRWKRQTVAIARFTVPRDERSLPPAVVWLALALATAVAAALRFPFLGHQSLWLDEIYTREIASESSLAGLWRHIQATESTPPLYYCLEWLVGARSAIAMRVIPALALTASVPVAYLAFRRLVAQRAALAAAAMLAVSPMLVFYSVDARSYGLLVLTSLLSVWAFTAVLEHGDRRRYGWWLLASVSCVWTHYFGAVIVAGEALLLFVLRPNARLRTAACSLLIGLCVAPLIPLVANQSASERAEFIAEIHLSSRLLTTAREFAMGPNVPRTWLEAAGLAIWSVGVAWGFLGAAREKLSARVLLALAVLSIGAPLLLAATAIADRFYARNVMLALPLMIALAAPVLLRARAIPLAAYLAVATLASLWVATNWRYEQLDWRDALRKVEKVNAAAPVIAVTRDSGPVAAAYLGRRAASATGLVAQDAWLVVEPSRPAGHRALTPASVPQLPGFAPVRMLETHAFRLVLVRASGQTHISAASVPGSVLFPGER